MSLEICRSDLCNPLLLELIINRISSVVGRQNVARDGLFSDHQGQRLEIAIMAQIKAPCHICGVDVVYSHRLNSEIQQIN